MFMKLAALSFSLGLVAAPALGQSAASSLNLADPGRAPASTIIDGAAWRCSGGACVASGGASQPADRACRRVVAQIGAVSTFSWQGRQLNSDQVAACNASARR